MSYLRKIMSLATAFAVAGGITVDTAQAADADYYKGKQITIVIGFSFAGTYGRYARSFADYLKKYIPGEPNIIVQSMPGAGGLKAMNYAYNVMPSEGYHLVEPLDTAIVVQLLLADKVKYDVRKFTWLGNSNQTNSVLVVRSDAPANSLEKLRDGQKLVVGATGIASDMYIVPRLMKDMLDLPGMQIVTGYKGSSNVLHVMEQGEVQAASVNWLAWNANVPHWFKGDKPFAKPILQLGYFEDPDLPGVPMASALVKGEDKAIVDFVATLGVIGRGLATPPGVPDHAIQTLRKAYDQMNADPEFEARLEKTGLRLLPGKGEDIQKVVEKSLENVNKETVARAREIVFGNK